VALADPVPSDRPWAILQHVVHEGPGSITPVLADNGVRTRVTRLDLGEPLPRAEDISGLVVMGGPMGVHDAHEHPWLIDERALLEEMVAAGLPVLGVCLGAQQLAAALGAEVSTGPVEEVGPGQVDLTGDGRRDPVLGPEYHGLSGTSIPCVHWHRDTFDLPRGSVHLAATRAFPHQAFRLGRRAYGLQFHVEVDEALAVAWRPLLPAGASLDGTDVARVESVGRRVLQRFVEVGRADVDRVAS
jgi:GMP synthase-like glutamine amidotransferase